VSILLCRWAAALGLQRRLDFIALRFAFAFESASFAHEKEARKGNSDTQGDASVSVSRSAVTGPGRALYQGMIPPCGIVSQYDTG
jgi:hypothetical protein